MPDAILITGPNLAADAVKIIEKAGFAPVYVPPYSSGDALIAAVSEADPVAIIARMGRIDGQVIAAAPRLRVISKHGVGVDTIDLTEAGARDIPVIVATGANATAVAEHAMALLFAVTKNIPALDAGLRAGRWEKPGHQGRELAGSDMGLVGFGAIARQTARYAKAFGINLFAYDPFCAAEAFAAEGVTPLHDVDELIARCDIISLHAPLTEGTRHLINADRLSRMKQDAIIINTARGALIDEAALNDALNEGRIAGAGLDSFAQEPPASDHPFWTQKRLVMTPHIGGVTAAANTRVGVQAAQGIIDLLAGRELPPARIVNRDLLASNPAIA